MTLITTLLLLIVGFIVLIRGAHYLVEGASSLAKKLLVSEIAIGLTVISFGTSAPELAVNVLAALRGNDEIIFGNIIGSNLMNILLVLGLSSAIYPLTVNWNTIWKEIPFSLLAVGIFLILANDVFINQAAQNELARSEGIILLLYFLLFLLYVFKLPRMNNEEEHHPIKVLSDTKTFLLIIIGMGFLALGGHLVQDNAIKLAALLGISQKMIGLTLVAGGTSLPELVTSVVAAYKHRMDLAVGNIVGSNIFNIFFILGVSSCIHSLSYEAVLNIDATVLAVGTLILFISLLVRRKCLIERWIGILFLVIYSGYFYYLILRK